MTGEYFKTGLANKHRLIVSPKIVFREAWLRAREELLVKEKEEPCKVQSIGRASSLSSRFVGEDPRWGPSYVNKP
jgi:hypothetical protein